MSRSEAEILMWEQLDELYKPGNRKFWLRFREFKFCPDRRWRFDFALINYQLGVHCNTGIEIEGGAFTQGRHTRGNGFIADMEKYNHAALLGWRVLRFTPAQVRDGTAIAFIRKVLDTR